MIDIGKTMPSYNCINANAQALARYAALCVEGGLVPIVEPEVLMDGDHDIDTCEKVTEWMLKETYAQADLLAPRSPSSRRSSSPTW